MPRRLRYASEASEADYRRWRTAHAAPLIRVGMLGALAGGFTIVATGQVLDHAYGDTFLGVVAVVSPGFVASSLIAWLAPTSRALLPIAAATTAVWGSALVWSLHASLDVASLGTTAVLLVSLWGLLVFRLPPAMGFVACALFTVMHQVGLAVSEESARGSDALHSTITWMVFIAVVGVALVVDSGGRTQFAQEHVIAAQHELIVRERRRADELLRNILPESIAARLKDGAGIIADHHDQVTVLFADLVGFTPLSMQLPATEVVTMLDEVFHLLDDIVDRHHVEKIKTVGDAYMAVAGAPEPRDDHAEAIAEVALDIVDALEGLSSGWPSSIEMRIGIATGDAIGGVIGRRKFAYDLWSDTVNTASRMESHGLPGRIQITDATASILAPGYLLQERGIVDLKGKGPTHTWFLNGRIAS